MTSRSGVDAPIALLAQEFKTRVITDVFTALADQARAETRSHEAYLAAVLARQVASRTAQRDPAADRRRAPTRREDPRGLHLHPPAHPGPGHHRPPRDHDLHPPQGERRPARTPRIGQDRPRHQPRDQGREAGYPVLFNGTTGWLDRLATAHDRGALATELRRLHRYRLLVIDEVGYLPLDAAAASLFFQLIANRYETGSIVLTSNLASAPGARPSATTSSPPPPSTGSSTTPTSPPSTATVTAPATTDPGPEPEPPAGGVNFQKAQKGSTFTQR